MFQRQTYSKQESSKAAERTTSTSQCVNAYYKTPVAKNWSLGDRLHGASPDLVCSCGRWSLSSCARKSGRGSVSSPRRGEPLSQPRVLVEQQPRLCAQRLEHCDEPSQLFSVGRPRQRSGTGTGTGGSVRAHRFIQSRPAAVRREVDVLELAAALKLEEEERRQLQDLQRAWQIVPRHIDGRDPKQPLALPHGAEALNEPLAFGRARGPWRRHLEQHVELGAEHQLREARANDASDWPKVIDRQLFRAQRRRDRAVEHRSHPACDCIAHLRAAVGFSGKRPRKDEVLALDIGGEGGECVCAKGARVACMRIAVEPTKERDLTERPSS
mmetsp:Transcript_5565/g.12848  ORF Transcript_5565/g.12848 Transcript_5565/m.12848 type:complete len:327 (-) Transcript_5565:851-1831(-)